MKDGSHSPKSKNCFIDRGDGENLEKWSMCLGTLARAAALTTERTSFIRLVILKQMEDQKQQEQKKTGCQILWSDTSSLAVTETIPYELLFRTRLLFITGRQPMAGRGGRRPANGIRALPSVLAVGR